MEFPYLSAHFQKNDKTVVKELEILPGRDKTRNGIVVEVQSKHRFAGGKIQAVQVKFRLNLLEEIKAFSLSSYCRFNTP